MQQLDWIMQYLKVKQLFFDRAAVKNALDKATAKALSRFGGMVRKTTRRSIRKRKGVSKPGNPPHSHTGLLKRFIFYSFDRDRKSVIIGPARLSRGTGAPHILEYSGTAEIKGKKVFIEKRPYMNPAFEKIKQKLPEIWRNSITS